MVNPFIKNKKLLTIYGVVWFVVMVFHTAVLSFFLSIDFYSALTDSTIFNGLYIFLGISLWYTVSFNSLDNYSASKIFVNHIGAAVITSGFWVFTAYYLLKNILHDDKVYTEFLLQSLLWRFLIGLMLYIVIVAVDYVIIYYNNFQEKVLREAELKGLIKEAELKTLKYQINPHFIFNSLNSISSLTISNPAKAQEMTIKLSSFMRSTLSKNEKQKSRLCDEIDNAKLYLDIEKIRFDEKFEFIEEIDEKCKNLEVPSMILQPLFENAIKHGVYESIDKVTIKLKCGHENEYFKIMVENSFDPEAAPRKGEGIGIKNIQNRLKLIYNQDKLITTEKTNNYFKVSIYIPI